MDMKAIELYARVTILRYFCVYMTEYQPFEELKDEWEYKYPYYLDDKEEWKKIAKDSHLFTKACEYFAYLVKLIEKEEKEN